MNKRERIYLLFILPSFVGMLIVYGIPYLQLFFYSVRTTMTDKTFAGFSQYIALFQNRAFLKAFGNTCFLCVAGVMLVIPSAILLSLVLLQCGKIRSLVQAGLILPLFVPAACIVIIWQIIFDQQGIINEVLKHLGVPSIDWMGEVGGKASFLVMFLWRNLGLNVIIFTGAMASFPVERREVARIEGAGKINVFFLVTLRHLTPAIVFASMLSLMNVLKTYREVYLLAGDYPPEGIYLLGHFLNNMLRQMKYPRMAAGAIVFTMVAAMVMGGLFLLEQQIGKDET